MSNLKGLKIASGQVSASSVVRRHNASLSEIGKAMDSVIAKERALHKAIRKVEILIAAEQSVKATDLLFPEGLK